MLWESIWMTGRDEGPTSHQAREQDLSPQRKRHVNHGSGHRANIANISLHVCVLLNPPRHPGHEAVLGGHLKQRCLVSWLSFAPFLTIAASFWSSGSSRQNRMEFAPLFLAYSNKPDTSLLLARGSPKLDMLSMMILCNPTSCIVSSLRARLCYPHSARPQQPADLRQSSVLPHGCPGPLS